MKNATLTVTFNAEKLDALKFHMSRKDTDLQEELNDTVEKLYEKYVPQATREYIDDKVARDVAGRDRPRRPARGCPAQWPRRPPPARCAPSNPRAWGNRCAG